MNSHDIANTREMHDLIVNIISGRNGGWWVLWPRYNFFSDDKIDFPKNVFNRTDDSYNISKDPDFFSWGPNFVTSALTRVENFTFLAKVASLEYCCTSWEIDAIVPSSSIGFFWRQIVRMGIELGFHIIFVKGFPFRSLALLHTILEINKEMVSLGIAIDLILWPTNSHWANDDCWIVKWWETFTTKVLKKETNIHEVPLSDAQIKI